MFICRKRWNIIAQVLNRFGDRQGRSSLPVEAPPRSPVNVPVARAMHCPHGCIYGLPNVRTPNRVPCDVSLCLQGCTGLVYVYFANIMSLYADLQWNSTGISALPSFPCVHRGGPARGKAMHVGLSVPVIRLLCVCSCTEVWGL